MVRRRSGFARKVKTRKDQEEGEGLNQGMGKEVKVEDLRA